MSKPASSAQFYRRPLPAGCEALASPAGRALFTSALERGHAQGFFQVIAQYSTQAEPAFCGLATLAIALNALAIDPGRAWKGVWRWYSEELLDCCAPLDRVKETGITLDAFACLARCNGASIEVHRPPPMTAGAGAAAAHSTADCGTKACCHSVFASASTGASEADFRSAVKSITAMAEGAVLVVAYSRRVLSQTGDGHFSPVGAYDPASDSVLILDTARFKHPPHWAPLPVLYEAMRSLDPDAGKPRGYAVLRRAAAVPLLLFHFSGSVMPRAAVDDDEDRDAVATSSKTRACRAPTSDLSGSLMELLQQLQRSLAACEADGCEVAAEAASAPRARPTGCCSTAASPSPSAGCSASAAPTTVLLPTAGATTTDATVRQGVRCFVRCYLAAVAAHGPIVGTVLGVNDTAGLLVAAANDATPSTDAAAAGAGAAASAAPVAAAAPSAAAAPALAARAKGWDYLSPEHRASVQHLLAQIESLSVYPAVCDALREAAAADGTACRDKQLSMAAAPASDGRRQSESPADAPSVRVSHVIAVMMLVWARLPDAATASASTATTELCAGGSKGVARVVRSHLREALQVALAGSAGAAEDSSTETPLANEVRLLALQMEAMLDGKADHVV